MTVGYGPLLRRDGPSPATRSNTLIQNAAEAGLLIEDDNDPAGLNGGTIWRYPVTPAGDSPVPPGRPVEVPAVVPHDRTHSGLRDVLRIGARVSNPRAQLIGADRAGPIA